MINKERDAKIKEMYEMKRNDRNQKMTYERIGNIFGISKVRVGQVLQGEKVKENKEIDILLGKNTDAEIAKKIGKTRVYVSNYRIMKGEKPIGKWHTFEKYLGIKKDKEIAKMAGITTGAVVRKRLRLGIAPLGTQKERLFQQKFIVSLSEPEQYVRTEYGIIDVMTRDAIYELKPVLDISACQQALGQLMIYKNAFSRKLYIVSEEVRISDNVKRAVEKEGVQIITFR